jgi:hypothetical protein
MTDMRHLYNEPISTLRVQNELVTLPLYLFFSFPLRSFSFPSSPLSDLPLPWTGKLGINTELLFSSITQNIALVPPYTVPCYTQVIFKKVYPPTQCFSITALTLV